MGSVPIMPPIGAGLSVTWGQQVTDLLTQLNAFASKYGASLYSPNFSTTLKKGVRYDVADDYVGAFIPGISTTNYAWAIWNDGTFTGTAKWSYFLKNAQTGGSGCVVFPWRNATNGRMYLAANADPNATSGNTGNFWAVNAEYAEKAGSASSADRSTEGDRADCLYIDADDWNTTASSSLSQRRFKVNGFYTTNIDFHKWTLPTGRTYAGMVMNINGDPPGPGDGGRGLAGFIGGNVIRTDWNGEQGAHILYFHIEAE